MKRLAVAVGLLLLASSASGQEAGTRLNCGSVEALEITSLSRTRVTAFLRTKLQEAPAGAKNSFAGKIEVANTPIPVRMPVTAMVQRGDGAQDVVLLIDLDLASVPAALLGNLHAAALDITLEGNLSSSTAPPMPVCAAGLLKIGTGEIRASGPIGQDFARFQGARFSGMTLTETQGQASVLVYNPLSFALDVKDLAYELKVGDRTIASGERHGFRIHPGRDNSLDLPLAAGNADLVAVLAGAMSGNGRIDGRLVATISVKVGKDQVLTVPLTLPGTIQVSR